MVEHADFVAVRHARDGGVCESRGGGLRVRTAQLPRLDLEREQALGVHERKYVGRQRRADDCATAECEGDQTSVVFDWLDRDHALTQLRPNAAEEPCRRVRTALTPSCDVKDAEAR